MQNTTRVDVLEPTQDLVEEELDVFIAESLVRFDDLSQICLHKVRDNIKFVEVLQGLWLQDALD